MSPLTACGYRRGTRRTSRAPGVKIMCGSPWEPAVDEAVPRSDDDTGAVLPVIVAVLVALVVAGVVLLVASASDADDRRDDESPLQAFRRGWRARRDPGPDQVAAARAAQAEPVDLSLAEFLRATAEQGEGYLQVDDLQVGLQRARDKAVRANPLRRHG